MINNIDELLICNPFSLNKDDKGKIFTNMINNLSEYHYNNCQEYRKICDILNDKMPLIPVRLFKDYNLKSIDDSNILKVVTSSGTSSNGVSKIYLDKYTAGMQTKVLASILSNLNQGKRLPMLIIDTKSVLKDRTMFSARGAGIIGFSMFGTDITYALDDNMELNVERVNTFFEKHIGQDIFIFGFTYMIWEFFYKYLIKNNIYLDKNKGFILHGGGWKKMIDQSVSNTFFKSELMRVTGVSNVYNYYGMIEQTGSIFIECEHGRFHSSIYSDVFILNYNDFSINDIGKEGFIQLQSLIPKSYPGHNILTEDIGVLLGEDDCPCGRLGKTFLIKGRIKNAEIRGCSDTFK